jgi:hypothetical protein
MLSIASRSIRQAQKQGDTDCRSEAPVCDNLRLLVVKAHRSRCPPIREFKSAQAELRRQRERSTRPP